jgi:hypothetical protein
MDRMLRGRRPERGYVHERETGLELVIDRQEILDILDESKEHGTAVGICAAALGQGMTVTAVDAIVIDAEVTIVLRNYDSTGYMLETNKLSLDEIHGVYPFQSRLENPWLRSLKGNKLNR